MPFSKSKAAKQQVSEPPLSENYEEVEEPEDPSVHFGRLEVRVGRVTQAYKEPNMWKSYTTVLDLGAGREEGMGSSEIALYYKPENLLGRLVLVVCNNIPLFCRGIACRNELLCASDERDDQLWADHVELLDPPEGSVPGDLVTVQGYTHKPDLPYINQYTIIFETIARKMRINTNKQAVYKDVPLEVEGKGFITAATLSDCRLTFE